MREANARQMADLLNGLRREGALVVCVVVWAELAAGPGVGPERCSRLLRALDIQVDYEIPRKAWDLAGESFSAYAQRRRAAGAGTPRRLLADFLVAAHAVHRAQRLVTQDQAFFRSVFPQLTLTAVP